MSLAETGKGVANIKVKETLLHYYKHVSGFSSYLERILPHLKIEQCNDEGEVDLLALLRSGLIAYDDDQLPTFKPAKDELIDVIDVIERAQAIILRRQKHWQFNNDVLTMGIRKADDRCDIVTVRGSTAVDLVQTNERVTQLSILPCWKALHTLIGAQAMEYLLTRSSLFLPLANSGSNYIQQWGANIGNAQGRHVDAPVIEGQAVSSNGIKTRRKRRRKVKEVDAKRINNLPEKLDDSLSNIDLCRSRMFYANAQHYRSGTLVTGLPVRHVLNRLSRLKGDTAPSTGLRRSDRLTAARRLAKYVWPREYGLSCAYSPKEDATNSKLITTTQRDIEIESVKRARTPSRLRVAITLLDIVLRKHRSFDYRRALDLCCPSTLPRRNLSSSERQTIILDLCEVGATQTQYATQVRLNDLASQPKTQVKAKAEKARYAKYKTSHGSITRYVRLILRSIVPVQLFGSLHNRAVILRACQQFIIARRSETMTLHEICQELRVSDCEWAALKARPGYHQRSTQTDARKRQSLVHCFVYWLFDGILLPLLRTNFYATESAKYRNRVLYFRQGDWQTLSRPILDSLKEQCFEHIDRHKAVAIMSRRDFGYSFVRLLPKEVGMRPIVNLKRRSVKIDRHPGREVKGNDIIAKGKDTCKGWGQLVRQKQSINAILGQTFQVLRCERETDPSSFGFTVSGPSDIFKRLSDFKSRLRKRHSNFGSMPLYFLKLDIAGAFDCIDQKRLLAIVDDVIHGERYITQRYVRITASRSHPLRTWPRVAVAEEMHDPFDAFAHRLTQLHSLRDTILVDAGNAEFCERTNLIDLLCEHINNNLIKIGKDICRQKVGIPQGSTLSTMLCNYYLARMERELSVQRASDEQDLLMRYTDDFLFVTTEIDSARRFFQNVQRASVAYNCVIAAEKSLSNFPMLGSDFVFDEEMDFTAASVVQVVPPRLNSILTFPWCGYRIDTRSLTVQYDWERYTSTCVADTLTVPSRKQFGSLMAKVISITVQRRNLEVYLDVDHNGVDVVLCNIYQAFVVAGLKYVAAYLAVRKRFRSRAKQCDTTQDLLLRYVIENVEHCYAHACAKMHRRRTDVPQCDADDPTRSSVAWSRYVTCAMYRWLALDAVQRVFSFRASTNRFAVSGLLATHRRTLQHPSLLDGSTLQALRTVATRSWRDTGHVIRTMALQ
jgi:telomerase reverse transcriptase